MLVDRGIHVAALRAVFGHGRDAGGHQAQEARDEESDDVLGRQTAHRRSS
jgi:hypothetical protein